MKRVESESLNNHRYALEEQDLATQWIQSYPYKTKSSQETKKNVLKFMERTSKPKVIYTDNSLEFGKFCETLSWNHCTSTSNRSETNGIAERAVRRVKEGTSAVLLQSGLDEKWWAASMEYYDRIKESSGHYINISWTLTNDVTGFNRFHSDATERCVELRFSESKKYRLYCHYGCR